MWKCQNFYGRSSTSWLCSRLALTASPTHFQGKTIPESSITPHFDNFSCAITHNFIGDPGFWLKTEMFSGRLSRPWLCSRMALTASMTHFKGQKSLKACIPIISTIFVCYSKNFFQWSDLWHPICEFFLDILEDIGYAAGCPSWPVRPIFKVNWSPKRAYPPFWWFSCDSTTFFWRLEFRR